MTRGGAHHQHEGETMRNRLTIFFAVAFAAIARLAVVGAVPAKAAIGAADDRQLTNPTGWATYTGVSPSTITSLLNTNHARLTDIQAESSSTFTVVMVANSGAYAVG